MGPGHREEEVYFMEDLLLVAFVALPASARKHLL